MSTAKNVKRVASGKFVPGNYVLTVKRSSAGLGLYAGEDIPKGKCIIEYVGREISEAEAYTSRSQYLFEVTKKKTIDGKPKWNKAGYINHSCKPNAEIEIRKEHVYVMALRNITAGEELGYDYGEEFVAEHIKPKGCKCIKHAPHLHRVKK